MRRRGISAASRMLSGSGRASLFAFRVSPQTTMDVLAHGLLEDGDLIVAVSVTEEFAEAHPEVDVRLDIEKNAPDPAVLIRSATLHALCVMSWLPADPGMDLPGLVGAVAGVPGVRLARVETSRVLLHDCAGVTAHAMADVLDARANQGVEEFDAVAAVAEIGDEARLRIIESVLTGRVRGVEFDRIEISGTCSHTLGTVRCLDVDSFGVTLMHIASTHATTFYVPFDDEAGTLSKLRAGLERFRSVELVA